MKTTWVRVIFLTAALLSPFTFRVRAARESPDSGQGHLSGMTARITRRDGTIRIARIQGVGCTASICSRTLIKGKADRESAVTAWLDSISAIQEITSTDALFVLKDGNRRRLSFVPNFRILYLDTLLGIGEKLDLALVKSVEFLPAST
jgi:hypothetical protein